ncbi:receptor-like protein 6 [Tripterygium wilfordii]|uniref:receptor-like protein 6 n=1 Tax=Tripterygium wilfordii TaxID=458696 RepID=UPI0018F7F7B1|nr:receptor-like protein 6 [Tripterygium wilfordii]
MSSQVPASIANMSSLRSIYLGNCGMFGLFPMEIFNLPTLQNLAVPVNENLTGYLPEFQRDSPLEILWLQGTNFSGRLPTSIGKLHSLTRLDIRSCNFYGPLPYSLGNLTNLRILILKYNNFQGEIPSSLANLTQLTDLSLSANNLSGGSMSWLGNQNKLTLLSLGYCGLTGEISPSLGNLTQLRSLILSWNRLTGRIPHWLANLTELTSLCFDNNELHGPIPDSISKLLNLEYLTLDSNHFSGILNLDMFFNLKNLTWLQISGNSFSSLIETSLNATLPKWRLLGLGSCNLTAFPYFLRYQDKLESLELGGNNIHGPIPNWLWNTGRETMWYLGLHFNSLTGFEQPLLVSSMSTLQFLYLHSNKLQGPVPIPPTSVVQYFVSNNSLTGELPLMLCNLPRLYFLDLSHNNLSGMLPQCLFNLEHSLSMLNLGHNSLHGTIPETFKNGSKLKMIDLSHNELQGKIPKSLANQITLESLNLGDNKIADKFPSWLGTLPNLKVLILRSNNLSGAIGRPTAGFGFSMLQIIDLSYNGFTGALPSDYFQNWNSMRTIDKVQFSYMEETTTVWSYGDKMTYQSPISYYYQLRMINKGVDTEYTKIPNILAAVDLSCNKFEGDIPESIITLKKLHSLNLSNNRLSGHIPSRIVNLTELESLDLSSNMLSGVIPQQMVQLTFLSVFNVSHNQLVGPIPQGKQFGTYENSSYKDNLGLCGKPLSNVCGNAPPASTVEDDQGSDSWVYIDWMVVLIGYGSGLMVGVVIGLRFTTWRHDWIMKTFGRRKPKRRRQKKRGGRV